MFWGQVAASATVLIAADPRGNPGSATERGPAQEWGERAERFMLVCQSGGNAEASAGFPPAIPHHTERGPGTREQQRLGVASSPAGFRGWNWPLLLKGARGGGLGLSWLPPGSVLKPHVSLCLFLWCLLRTGAPFAPSCPCREQVIQPMGITPSGNLAPMENAIRDMADEHSSSDSDLGLD